MGKTESVFPGTATAPAGALEDSVEEGVADDADSVLVSVAVVPPSLEGGVVEGDEELGGTGIELLTVGLAEVAGMERVLAIIEAPIDVVDAVVMDVLPPSTGTSVHEVTSINLD